MKKIALNLLAGIVLMALALFSCEKGDLDLKSPELGIDIRTNIEGLQRALQMEGHFYSDSSLPPKSAASFTPTISVIQRQIDLRHNSLIYIPFDISIFGGGKLPHPLAEVTAFNMTVKGATGCWKMPPFYDDSTQTYAIVFVIPKLVKLDSFWVKFNAEIRDKRNNAKYVTRTDSAGVISIPTVPCNTAIRGKWGPLKIVKVNLGDRKGKVTMHYDTGRDPDRIDLRYGENFIFSTADKLLPPGRFPFYGLGGFDTTGHNTDKTFVFEYDPKISKDVVVYGLAHELYANSEWEVTVDCVK